MTLDNRHLSPEKIKLYIELSGKKNQLAEEEKKILNDIESHLNRCFKCNAEYLFLKSVYFPRISKYESSKRIRNTVLVGSASIIVLLFLTQTIFFSDNKPEEILADIDNGKEIVLENSIEVNEKEGVFITKEDSIENEQPPVERNESEDLIELIYAYVDLKKSNKIESNLVSFADKSNVELPKVFIEDYRQDLRIKNINIRNTEIINVVSPENLSILTIPITFEWTKIEDTVTIVIKNNQNENIWEKKIAGTSKVELNEKLNSGIYYWDIRVNDKLRNKYKFFVIP